MKTAFFIIYLLPIFCFSQKKFATFNTSLTAGVSYTYNKSNHTDAAGSYGFKFSFGYQMKSLNISAGLQGMILQTNIGKIPDGFGNQMKAIIVQPIFSLPVCISYRPINKIYPIAGIEVSPAVATSTHFSNTRLDYKLLSAYNDNINKFSILTTAYFGIGFSLGNGASFEMLANGNYFISSLQHKTEEHPLFVGLSAGVHYSLK